MKRLLALLLALIMSFTLFACTTDEGPDDTDNTPPTFDGEFDTPITDVPLG